MDNKSLDIERQKFQANKENTEKLSNKIDEMVGVTKVATMFDLNRLSNSLSEVIKEFKSEVDKQIKTQGESSTGDFNKVSEELSKTEKKLIDLINSSEETTFADIQSMIENVSNQIETVRQAIPTVPSLSPIENDIAGIRQELNNFNEQTNIKINSLTSEIKSLIPKIDDAEAIARKLITIKRAWLPLDAIDGDFSTRIVRQFGGGNTRPLDVIVNDSSLGGFREINFKGSRVTSEIVNGVLNLTVEAGYQVPTSGAVNGTNATFVWATTPNAICVDGGRVMKKVSSDGTVNWTGETTTVLTIAPNNDIFAVS